MLLPLLVGASKGMHALIAGRPGGTLAFVDTLKTLQDWSSFAHDAHVVSDNNHVGVLLKWRPCDSVWAAAPDAHSFLEPTSLGVAADQIDL